MSALTYSHNPHPLLFKVSQSVSQDSKTLRKIELNAQSNYKNTLTEGSLEIFESDIWDIQKQCESEGWSDSDAKPVSSSTARRLIKFYREKILPLNIANPEISPFPDGFLGLEWISSHKDRILIVPEIESIIYASIVGSNKNHGEIGVEDELPETIIGMLKKYFPQKFSH
jgi:hypothetical protein